MKIKKKSKTKKEKSVETKLWDTADKLRGSVEASEYKHIVLSLIFLKFTSDLYEKKRKELIDSGNKKYIEIPEFYQKDNLFYIPEKSTWNYIVSNSKQTNISLVIDKAFTNIEKKNPSLEGALPNNYFTQLDLETNKLSSLLDNINNNLQLPNDNEGDFIGRVYEYFLKKFSIKEGKKGEYYTPKSVVNLMTELIEPYEGVVYDPCCGTGGMFVQSIKFIESHKGNRKKISIYGQEQTSTTHKLAKMNLALRGISANLAPKARDTFSQDQHKELKADFIIANPPFNLDDWRGENELIDDDRWKGYSVPPVSNANYAWILHIISKLKKHGHAAFLLANGALSAGAEEKQIREKLIENDLVETIITLPRDMFYSTDISVTLWIINKDKKNNLKKKDTRSTENQILFFDLRRRGIEIEKYIELNSDERSNVKQIYTNWKSNNFQKTYKDIGEYCYSASLEEIKKNNYSLITSEYVKFINKETDINYDKEMKQIQKNFKNLLEEEKEVNQLLKSAFKKLGHEI
ncbi:type I restriction-modification system subunit M [Candidatus Pelagibacter sp.]|uniref:type I restriction-modification system subunit M n=1 Tax=Candidatus Pelagibacter sp. TaxID=2024849 RepID=UPI003F852CB9